MNCVFRRPLQALEKPSAKLVIFRLMGWTGGAKYDFFQKKCENICKVKKGAITLHSQNGRNVAVSPRVEQKVR